jgi:hypothetical protein
VAKLRTGTLISLAQTAAANLPPDTNELYIFPIAASGFGISISPQRHSAASNDEFARSKPSASLSLNSIMSCNLRNAALSFAMASICLEMSVFDTNQMDSSTYDPISLKWFNVKAGTALLKDGESGGSLLRKELKSSVSDKSNLLKLNPDKEC